MSVKCPLLRALIDHSCGFEDGFTAEGVTTLFNGTPADQVYLPSEYLLQLSLHPNEVEQSMPCSWPESYKYVYVAFGGEVVAKAGAEQRELHNVPLPAERLYPILGHTDR